MPNAPNGIYTFRPNVMGTRHVVAAGHYMSAQAGLMVLQAGGNAIDAGVAVGLATAVLEPTHVSLAGVAPIILRHAASNRIVTISGLGWWPKAASCEYFQREHGGEIPIGLPRTVIPAAPDAWITALEHFGTMSFAEVASAAIRLAGDGFPTYPRLRDFAKANEAIFRQWPSSAAIYLRAGRPPEAGELFLQCDAARMLQYMADEERAAAKQGRRAGLQAARRAFYRGDIAIKIAKHFRENGGLLTEEDLATFRVAIEPPVHTTFHGVHVYGCGPWTQGPMLLRALNLLEGMDLAAIGHNSPDYVHTLTETLKIVAADREAWYGDPRFVDVPMQALLDKTYAVARRKLIGPHAWIDMPPAGIVSGEPWRGVDALEPTGGHLQSVYDTSYLCVVDHAGNAFSATPSDGSASTPILPGLGCVISPRGDSSWTDLRHPSSVMPGKRPRLTCNPALAIRDGESIMPFGTPGGDVQVQTMLQVFLNIVAFGMDPQQAVEAPRFAGYGFPSSFWPHDRIPGRLNLEPEIGAETGTALEQCGHHIEWWPGPMNAAGTACAIIGDLRSGLISGGADIRRNAYAVGW